MFAGLLSDLVIETTSHATLLRAVLTVLYQSQQEKLQSPAFTSEDQGQGAQQ